ncbi:uncharacterized protein [Amphiura filiformis]|uniref:uncharacterized protein isoform X1 n=1 Tax=Amphiura filiformis TaxID=82378 RepID=UPI003B213998
MESIVHKLRKHFKPSGKASKVPVSYVLDYIRDNFPEGPNSSIGRARLFKNAFPQMVRHKPGKSRKIPNPVYHYYNLMVTDPVNENVEELCDGQHVDEDNETEHVNYRQALEEANEKNKRLQLENKRLCATIKRLRRKSRQITNKNRRLTIRVNEEERKRCQRIGHMVIHSQGSRLSPLDRQYSKQMLKQSLPEIPPTELSNTVKSLGTGTFSKVSFCKYLRERVAVKEFRSPEGRSKQEWEDSIIWEASIMMAMPSHAHICNLKGVVIQDDSYRLVMEYIGGHSLWQILFRKDTKAERDRMMWPKVMKAIATGMEWMKRYNIVHNDLHESNILIDSNHVPRIIDFGKATLVEPTQENSERYGLDNDADICEFQKSRGWIPPEILKDQAVYSPTTDAYAFGYLLQQVKRVNRLPWKMILKETADGINALHSMNIIHNDLKEDNIMIRHDNKRPVIIDFGKATFIDKPRWSKYKLKTKDELQEWRDDYPWIAPELLEDRVLPSESTDAFSYGFICHSVCDMTRYQDETLKKVWENLYRCEPRESLPTTFSWFD